MIEPKNYALLTAQSMGASFQSAWIPMKYYWGLSIQAVWTGGSAAGTLNLQVSNDPDSVATKTPTDYTGSSLVVAGAGNWFWDVTQTAGGWFRLNFVYTSGTGSLSAQVNGKTVS